MPDTLYPSLLGFCWSRFLPGNNDFSIRLESSHSTKVEQRGGGCVPSESVLRSFCVGAAAGMTHLASLGIVHCDLAARNWYVLALHSVPMIAFN